MKWFDEIKYQYKLERIFNHNRRSKKAVMIIGYGPVGQAMANVATKAGYRPFIVDTNGRHTATVDFAYDEILQQGYNLWGCVVAVSTPPNEDGSVNTENVKSVIQQISDLSANRRRGRVDQYVPVLLKSTVPPSFFTDWWHWMENKPENGYLKDYVCFSPEFLSGSTGEQSPYKQYLSYDFELIGGDMFVSSIIFEQLIDPGTRNHRKFVGAGELLNQDLAFMKYLENCFLATKVIFYNEMREMFFGSNYGHIKSTKFKQEQWDKSVNAIAHDVRLSTSHWQVPFQGKTGYDGHCLPKDMSGFIHEMEQHGLDPTLLKVVRHLNEYHLNQASSTPNYDDATFKKEWLKQYEGSYPK